jgi:hypothetical protein
MDPAVLEQLVPIIAIVFGVSGGVCIAALFFPQLREALADRLRSRGGAPVTEVRAAVAEVQALRGEIYALRSELAAVSRALPPAGAAAGGRLGTGT